VGGRDERGVMKEGEEWGNWLTLNIERRTLNIEWVRWGFGLAGDAGLGGGEEWGN